VLWGGGAREPEEEEEEEEEEERTDYSHVSRKGMNTYQDQEDQYHA
jgi:hypothetical protein